MSHRDQKVLAVKLFSLAIFLLAAAFFMPGVFHNAAHDVRHSLTIPCH